jgi:bifunctional DNA-binding transcriptional regulator/antitoxin component of YhaV-PrlF toxin-antitoxin module
MDLTTVSPKYQVVIPELVRGQFGLAPGQPPAALRGFLKGENTFQREPDRL